MTTISFEELAPGAPSGAATPQRISRGWRTKTHTNRRLAVKNSVALCAGVLIFAAPWLLFLIYHGQLQTYLWESSFGVAGQVAGLALPAPMIDSSKSWLSVENRVAYSYAFWFAIPVISAAVLRLQWERLEPILRKEIVVTIVLAGLCLLQATHRSGYGHLIQSVACCYVLLGFLYQSAAARSPARPSLTARNYVTAAVALIFLAISVSAGSATISRSIEVLGKKFDSAYMYFLSPPDFVYQAAIRFPKHQVPPMIRAIQKFTTADEAILVVPYRTTFYPLSQRRFAGGQMLMAPGYFSSNEEQQNLINVLKEQGDPMVIEITGGGGFDRIEERQTRVFASLFYEHIDANYRALEDPDIPWGYTFWMHKDKVSPTL